MALLQMFYILHGVVYPTSTPLLLVESRLSRASHHLTTALSLTRKRCVDMLAADDDVSADDMMPPISMGSGQVVPSKQPPPPPIGVCLLFLFQYTLPPISGNSAETSGRVCPCMIQAGEQISWG